MNETTDSGTGIRSRYHRFLTGVVLLWVLAACSDRIGEPIYRSEARPGADAGTTIENVVGDAGEQADGFSTSSTGADSGTGISSSFGLPLCEPCETQEDCGGRFDLCLLNDQTRDRFCGRDCLEDGGCPDGFVCYKIDGPGGFSQCVPTSGSCEPTADAGLGAPSQQEMKAYVVERLNALRAEQGLAPLVPDECLDRIAQEAALEFSWMPEIHSKFNRECAWDSPCECGWSAEIQSAGHFDRSDWRGSLDQSIEASLTSSGGAGADNILSVSFTRVGVGIIITASYVWQSYEFAPP